MHPDANRWNGRYAEEGSRWLDSEPARLLQEYLPRLPVRGLALDAAAGVGVNSIALARHGLQVIALDISEVGLRLARQEASRQGIALETAVYDLSRALFPAACCDVIINFRYLERATFAAYRRALKSGGWLIFETFVRTDRVQSSPAYFLEPGELSQAFRDWEIVHAGEREVWRNGRLYKVAAQLVARKPH